LFEVGVSIEKLFCMVMKDFFKVSKILIFMFMVHFKGMNIWFSIGLSRMRKKKI